MAAAHPGDDAEAARVVAALGDLHVGEVARGEAEARGLVVGDVDGAGGDIEQRFRVWSFEFEVRRQDGFGFAEGVPSAQRFTGVVRGGFGFVQFGELCLDSLL
jgi:hypothetical protein